MNEKIDWEALKKFSYELYVDLMLKKRIAEALENLNEKLIPVIAKGIGNILREEGEESVVKPTELVGVKTKDMNILSTDSNPTPIRDMELKRSLFPKASETKPLPKKGKYTWFPIKGGGKVRTCNNEGCNLFLKYNDDKKTYQHGKYDALEEAWLYVADGCEFWGG